MSPRVVVASTLDRSNIQAVHRMIRAYVRETPTMRVDGKDFGLESCLPTMKLEQLQHAGSFKTRGAFANLLTVVQGLPAGSG